MTNPSMRTSGSLTVVVARNERPVGDRFTLRTHGPSGTVADTNQSSHASRLTRQPRPKRRSRPRSTQELRTRADPARPSRSPPTCAASTRSSSPQLAVEIRETIVGPWRTTGGHLGSSLGVVELTIALHRLLESPRDRIVWDTGHQAYPHKLLTGRLERFGTLRQLDGVGGFPRRSESAARRVRWRTRRDRACRSPRASPRRATCATGSSGSRSSSATRRS